MNKEIYQMEVPAKTKVPKDWVQMSKTQQVARYWNDTIRKHVNQILEAREVRDEVLRTIKLRMFQKFDELYQDWYIVY